MTDIAQLGYEVDSSGLVAATRALDANAEAAVEASGAAQMLETEWKKVSTTVTQTSAALSNSDERFRAIAQQAMAYAEASRGANLSDRALAEAARDAAAGIDWKAQVMARAGTEQERMAQRVQALQESERRATEEAQKAARAAELQEINLRKLLGQIDPTVAALDRLADMEERLERARDLGALSPEVFEQYQQKIDAARAATLNMGKASDVATKSLGSLNLAAVSTQQSIASLVRAVATGQWGQAQASITSLTARTGMLGTAFSGAGAVIGAAGLSLAAFASYAIKGYIEARRLEGVVLGLGQSSGYTTGQLLAMRDEIGRVTGRYDDATQAINQLVLAGKTSGDMLRSIAAAAVDIARTTGQSIGTVTTELQTLADGGEDALLRLNDRYKFLTIETYNHITALRQQKGDFEANAAAVRELERVMADRSQQMVDSAGYVEKAWRGVVNIFNLAKRAAMDFGRTDLDAQIAKLQRQIQSSSVTRDGLVRETAYTKILRERLAVLQEQKRALDAKAEADAKDAQYQRDAIAAEAEARKGREAASDAINRRIEAIDKEAAKLAERNRIIAEYNKLAEDDPRHFDGSMERLLAASDKAIEERFAKNGVGAARAAERLQSRLARGSDAIEKYIRQWQTALDGTGNKVMDDFARRLDFIQEKVADFERMGLPADKIHAFAEQMTKLAEAIRDKDIREYLEEFEFGTRELTASFIPGADAVLRYERAVYELNQELAAGILTQDAYERRLNALQVQRDGAFHSMRRALTEEGILLRMNADDQEVWNNLMALGAHATDEQRREIEALTRARQADRDAIYRQIDAMDGLRQAGAGLFSDLARGVEPMEALYRAVDRVHQRITDLVSENIWERMLGKRGDAGGGKFGDFFGNLFGDLFGVDGIGDEADGLSRAATDLTASGGTLLTAASALSASAAALSAAGVASGPGAGLAGMMGGGGGFSSFLSGIFGGARENGGDVWANKVYRVGERNRPEVLNTSRGQFLIPGDNGRVEPMGSGSRLPTVNQKIIVQGRMTNDTAKQLARRSAEGQRLAVARFGA